MQTLDPPADLSLQVRRLPGQLFQLSIVLVNVCVFETPCMQDTNLSSYVTIGSDLFGN
jgi:hypothetical protein